MKIKLKKKIEIDKIEGIAKLEKKAAATTTRTIALKMINTMSSA